VAMVVHESTDDNSHSGGDRPYEKYIRYGKMAEALWANSGVSQTAV
jgi:hypothetical protein